MTEHSIQANSLGPPWWASLAALHDGEVWHKLILFKSMQRQARWVSTSSSCHGTTWSNCGTTGHPLRGNVLTTVRVCPRVRKAMDSQEGVGSGRQKVHQAGWQPTNWRQWERFEQLLESVCHMSYKMSSPRGVPFLPTPGRADARLNGLGLAYQSLLPLFQFIGLRLMICGLRMMEGEGPASSATSHPSKSSVLSLDSLVVGKTLCLAGHE
jgi:hypothetical protein